VAHINGHVRTAAPVEQVFDTVADSRNHATEAHIKEDPPNP